MTRRRLLVAVTLGLATLVAPSATAWAESGTAASLSDVVIDGHQVTAVLTAPAASTGPVAVTGVQVRVGGRPVPATVTPVPTARRSAALVIDTSGSMGTAGIAAAARAANTYLAAAPAGVAVALVSFGDKPRLVVPATTDRAKLRAALATLRPQGRTAMYDAVALALRSLDAADSRSLVLISDGRDTTSSSTLAQVAGAVGAASARLEAVAFGAAADPSARSAALAQLASAGAGRVVSAGDANALAAAFRNAATALGGQVQLRLTLPTGTGGAQTLSVQAQAGGRAVQAATGLTLPDIPSAPAPTRPTTVAPYPAGSRWLLLGGIGAVFAGVLGLVIGASARALRPVRRQRLRSLAAYTLEQATTRVSAATDPDTGLGQQALRLSDRYVAGRAGAARAWLLIQRADLPLRVNEWYVLRAAAAVTATCLGVLVLRGSLVGVVVGAALGAGLGIVLPVLLLKTLAARRAKAFEQQLPDVITLVATSLTSGFSLSQALDAVVRDSAEPAAKEFSRALAEARIGAELEDSLDRLAERMGSTSLTWTTMAIRIQRQVGGNLAETLRTTAHTLRDRASLHRQVRTLSAEGRLSSYILIGLPIGLFLYLSMVNRPYISLLWLHPLGWAMSAAGLVALGIGVVWMRAVVKVEA